MSEIPATFAQLLHAQQSSLSERELVAGVWKVVDGWGQSPTIDLPEHAEAVWDQHSGIPADDGLVERAAFRSLTTAAALVATALTADQVATRLGLDASTVRHYRVSRRLYSINVDGRVLFPRWQFDDDGTKVIPGLMSVVPELDPELHPWAVTGFFSTPNPELLVGKEPRTPRAWLMSLGDPKRVSALARRLGESL